jgi:peptide-methionine (S)-S-oxide reductase
MRQGNDIGSQYRSAVFFPNEMILGLIQETRSEYQKELTQSGYGEIVTEVIPEEHFYYAEDYHQQYLAKNPNGYCGLGGTGVCLK